MRVRAAGPGDGDALWAILAPIFAAGETYAIDPKIGRAEALELWTGGSHRAFVIEAAEPLGTYYIGPNQGGGGAHVANAGFATASGATGRGVARAMLDHALATAVTMGFRAMQFNFVVATNTRALDIWTRAGFETVGRLPGAFRNPKAGYVDALILYRWLV
ncbi:MAG: GNAT family N-acetyltransferase [Pseudomonadota bacterium]